MTNLDNKWPCHGCGKNLVEVEEGYDPEYCCSGLSNQCGCMGQPTNPVFCNECERQLFEHNQHDYRNETPE